VEFKNKYKQAYIIIWAILLPMFLFLKSQAQEIQATAKLDSNKIIIGQQVPLKLTVEYTADKGKRILINWPQINDTIIKQVEVVSQTKIDTIIPDKDHPLHFIQTNTL